MPAAIFPSSTAPLPSRAPIARALAGWLAASCLVACGVSESPSRSTTAEPPAEPSTTVGAADADAAVPAPPSDAAVSAAEGVIIAGQFVPREKVIVFLHVGHSNMAGRASTPAELLPYYYDTDPHLWAFGKGDAWRAAREPLAGDASIGDTAGPGMAILHGALAQAPDKYIVSIGHGQSGLVGATCAAYCKGGLLYDIVMAPARALRGKVTFGGLFTMLGITEAQTPAPGQRPFSDCMATLAADVRADLGEPDLPFLVGDYERGATRVDLAPSTPFGQNIIAEIKLIPGKTTRAAIIPSDDLPMQDDHHYNLLGHKLWATRGFQIMQARAWLPWAAAF